MKTSEELLIEISAASRITRDGRLLVLLGELKEFLESLPPAHQEAQAPYLGPRGGRTLTRDGQLKKNAYMASYMRKRRAKQKEAKLAIINSTTHPAGPAAEVPALPELDAGAGPEDREIGKT